MIEFQMYSNECKYEPKENNKINSKMAFLTSSITIYLVNFMYFVLSRAKTNPCTVLVLDAFKGMPNRVRNWLHMRSIKCYWSVTIAKSLSKMITFMKNAQIINGISIISNNKFILNACICICIYVVHGVSKL